MKLNEFRLETFEERFVLGLALSIFRSREEKRDPEFYEKHHAAAVDALMIRISRTECQPGGCPYCNADRAREEDEWRAEHD